MEQLQQGLAARQYGNQTGGYSQNSKKFSQK